MEVAKEEKELRPVLTKKEFQGLCARYGFSQAESGTLDLLNETLVAAVEKITKQGILQADHDKQSGLNGGHAKKAVEMTKEIPKGFF
jgi:uncharacterized protein YidB (DUF937 family)